MGFGDYVVIVEMRILRGIIVSFSNCNICIRIIIDYVPDVTVNDDVRNASCMRGVGGRERLQRFVLRHSCMEYLRRRAAFSRLLND